MGAWDCGIFDDDTAMDVLDELLESENIIEDMKKYFGGALKEDYIEYDMCHYVLVSSAIIDSVINGTKYETGNDEYEEFIEDLDGAEIDTVRKGAIKALNAILSEKSELNELWMENGDLYEEWRKNVEDLNSRLN